VAKITPPQEIPSELLDPYRKSMGEASIDNGVQKRHPFRVPTSQTEVGHPTAAQLKQRTAFKNAIIKFNALSWPERQRWYATMPEWGSFLWYYNWFMLNAIPNLWGVVPGGAAILKSIQHKTISIPAGTGEGSVAITAVDPTKCVVMLYGNSFLKTVGTAEDSYATVYPRMSSLAAELVKCKWSIPSFGGGTTQAADIGITIIEYI